MFTAWRCAPGGPVVGFCYHLMIERVVHGGPFCLSTCGLLGWFDVGATVGGVFAIVKRRTANQPGV